MVSGLRSGWVAEEQSGVGGKFGFGARGVWDLCEEQLETQLDTGPARGGELGLQPGGREGSCEDSEMTASEFESGGEAQWCILGCHV